MTTSEKIVLKIGSKGEIFPPKKIREQLGLNPDQPILMLVHNDRLIIRKLDSIENILKTPPKAKKFIKGNRRMKVLCDTSYLLPLIKLSIEELPDDLLWELLIRCQIPYYSLR